MAPCHSGCGRHTSHASETSHETFSEAPQLAALKQGGLVQEGYEVYHCLALLLYSLLYPDTPWMMQCHIYLHCLSTLCVGSGSSPRSGDTSVSGVRSEVLATERGAHAADEAGGVGGGRGEVEAAEFGGGLGRVRRTFGEVFGDLRRSPRVRGWSFVMRPGPDRQKRSWSEARSDIGRAGLFDGGNMDTFWWVLIDVVNHIKLSFISNLLRTT